MGAVICGSGYMDKSVLEKISDVYLSFANRLWENGTVCIPSNFNNMSQEEKRNYANNIQSILKYMIVDNQFETLFSWSWNEMYNHYSFEKWLSDEVINRFDKIQKQHKTTAWEYFVNKLKELKDRKQA